MRKKKKHRPFSRGQKEKKREWLGKPPGELEGRGGEQPERVTRIVFNHENFSRRVMSILDKPSIEKEDGSVTWINIDGIPGKERLEQLSEIYGIHPLVLEDIQHTGQRAKIEDHGSYLFIVFPMLWWNSDEENIREEQVSLILSGSTVISIQEREGDIFDLIRDRLEKGGGRIRRMGADYLAYALLDAVIDSFFPLLESVEDMIEQEELEIIREEGNIERVHNIRRELIALRRHMWPLREVLIELRKAESDLITDQLMPFLGDIYDHGLQILDTIEVFRDNLSGLVDLHISQLSNTTNKVMKVLTIMASIFIPLTFIAGIYGMNFQHMPELSWKYGYPIVIGVMTLAGIGMLIYFKRKKWI